MITNLWANSEEYVTHSGKAISVENPATGKIIDQLVLADKHYLDHVIKIAREAQKERGRTALAKCADIVFRFRQLTIECQDKIISTIVREDDKIHGDALGGIVHGCETIDFVCGVNAALKGEFTDQASTGIDTHALRRPVSVTAGIRPFNFPAMVSMWVHPIVLATGNTLILKVVSVVPNASPTIACLCKGAGLPDGLLNVIAGDRHLVIDTLTYPGIDAILFVGSTPVARIVQDTDVAHGRHVQALGGANNHTIVVPDVDTELTARYTSVGAFGAVGQRCMALLVITTVDGVGEKLVLAVKARTERTVIGPDTGPASEMGPVIIRSSQERITKWIDEAEAKGVSIVLDSRGYCPEGEEHANGLWLAPTIIDGVDHNLNVYCEEVFGPVLAVVRVDTYEEAIKIASSSGFGNGFAIFISDGDTARHLVVDVEAGMVGIDVLVPVPVAYYSFGGRKESLLGDTHIHGLEGVRFYTKAKVVTTR